MTRDIFAYVRAIMIGNDWENMFDALRLRIKGKPSMETTLWEELGVVFRVVGMIPAVFIQQVIKEIGLRIEAKEGEEDNGDEDQIPTITTSPSDTPEDPPEDPDPCNHAKFISETVEDGTDFDPNDNFTKTWRLKNDGTCTWNTNYKLVFADGDQMSGPANKNLTQSVAPGEQVDVSVDLKAPGSAGTYKGIWKVADDEGQYYVHLIYVEIEVIELAAPSTAFTVTSVNLTAIPPSFLGPCPFIFAFTANITTNGLGTVSYYWKRSDGMEYGHGSIVFGSAGTQTVGITSIAGMHWMKIYIDEPNHQFFGPVNFQFACQL